MSNNNNLTAALNEVNSVSNLNTFTTIAPSVSFFQQEYARHTNFAIAECEVDMGNTITYGQTGVIDLPRLGDMMTSSFMKIQRNGLRLVPASLPAPAADANNTNISFVNSYAHALFKYLTFEVGSIVVDRVTGEILQMAEELTSPSGNEQGALIGDFPSYQQIREQTYNATTYYMAVRFFFFDSVEMAIPLLAWSAHQTRFRYTLNPISTLVNVSIDNNTGAGAATISDLLALTTYTDSTGTVWELDQQNKGDITKISLVARIICLTQAERACIAGDIIETLFTQFQFEEYDTIVQSSANKSSLMSYNNIILTSMVRYRCDWVTDSQNPDTKDFFDYTLRRPYDSTNPWAVANQRPSWFPQVANSPVQLYQSPIDTWSLYNNGQQRFYVDATWGTQVVPLLYAVKKPKSQFLSYAWHLAPWTGASAPAGGMNASRINQSIERVTFNVYSGSSVLLPANLNVSAFATAPSTCNGSLFHASKSYNVSKSVAGHLQVRFA